MSKWTKNPEEIRKISEVSQELVGMTLVWVTLDSGETLEGVIRNLSVGNNAVTAIGDGHWLFYGNFDIETIDGQRFNIDMCNVQNITDIWQERSGAYEKAGLIGIVR